MKTLNVELGERSYPIYIGTDLLDHNESVQEKISGSTAVVVSNTTVAPLYLERVMQALLPIRSISVILPDGEQYKTLEYLNKIFDDLLTHHCDRKTTLVALGGGVIGDMTGFAAACYMRGVPFIQVPTTLLAQVDSSVGGKTGVNHPLGKNMIGAFYQPRSVIIDITTLDTLADNEFSAGIAEIIKYGLIRDEDFFGWLEKNMDRLLARNVATLTEAIYRSCAHKAEVVAEDEKETGNRALLNLGHTFGHAIETGLGYGVWLHGEAVAVGMVMAADMSMRLGWINQQDVDRVTALVSRARLPVRYPSGLATQRFKDLMAVDKKAQEGKVHFVLLRGIGQAVITDEYNDDVLMQTLESRQTSENVKGLSK